MNSSLPVALAALLLSAPVSFAQEEKPLAAEPPAAAPATKLEAFLGKRGSLIVRNFKTAGAIDGDEQRTSTGITLHNSFITVTALSVYEPGKENVKLKGLQVEISQAVGRDAEGMRVWRDSLSFVDAEEAESLSKALHYLSDLTTKWKGQDVGQKEVYFKTQAELKIGINQTGAKDVMVWAIGGDFKKAKSNITAVDGLTTLKGLVDQGVAWLKTQ